MLTEPAPQEVKPFVNRRNETEIRPERAIRPRRLQEALEGHQRKWICLTLVALLLKKFHFLGKHPSSHSRSVQTTSGLRP